MSAILPRIAVVFDERVLWHLASGTVVRELGVQGRTFVADDRTPGRLWNGIHQCPVHAIEMPVEVSRRET